MSTLMSLLSVQGESRSRSKSPGGRERSRSRSNVRDDKSDKKEGDRRRSSRKTHNNNSDSDPEKNDRRAREKRSSKKHYDSDSDDGKHKSSRRQGGRRRSDSDSESDGRDRRRDRTAPYANVKPNIVTASPTSMTAPQGPLSRPSAHVQPAYGQVHAYSYNAPSGHAPQPPGAFPEYPHGALSETRHMSYVGHDPRYAQPPPVPVAPPRGADHRQRALSSTGQQYAQVGQWQYAQVTPGAAYKNPTPGVNQYAQPIQPQLVQVDPRHSNSRIIERKHSEDKYKPREHDREKRYSEDKYRSRDEVDRREKKPEEAARRLSHLSLGGAAGAATLGVASMAAHGPTNGGKPPASPLLEAYTGTYQTISPMPSPLSGALVLHRNDSDISDAELDSDDSGISDGSAGDRKRRIKRLEKERQWIEKKREKEDRDHVEYERKRPTKQQQYEVRSPDDDDMISSVGSTRSSRKQVSWYDAESDAKVLAAGLKGTSTSTKPPNIKPLIQILPHLTIDDLEALKIEYKKHATIGGQGINMSKHIKVRVPGHLGKAAYACSLGQYESDAYWANCFYQSGASRRELLIESLMGRTNQQIREVKNFFKDKKYDDDLEKCLKAELKADKFRTAILLALEERRQAESPMLDRRLVKNDVLDLYDALHSAGGESTMIQIIVVRSDNHLREVLRQYEREYDENFARAMIHKSRNLVVSTLDGCTGQLLTKTGRNTRTCS